MKLVFTHENKIIVDNIKNLIELDGIATEMKNAFSGGAIGELAPIDTWPELWVEDGISYKKAKRIVDSFNETEFSMFWICDACGEENAQSFGSCWQCQSDSPVPD